MPTIMEEFQQIEMTLSDYDTNYPRTSKASSGRGRSAVGTSLVRLACVHYIRAKVNLIRSRFRRSIAEFDPALNHHVEDWHEKDRQHSRGEHAAEDSGAERLPG